MGPKPSPRVFLDSNVFFSGLYSSEGPPGMILSRFIEGRLRVVISRQVLDEVVETIRDRLPDDLPFLRKLLMSAPPEIVEDPTPEGVARWAKVIQAGDAAILAAAVAAQPDYLITGDKHFLANGGVAEKSGLEIVTPAQFLERWQEGAGRS